MMTALLFAVCGGLVMGGLITFAVAVIGTTTPQTPGYFERRRVRRRDGLGGAERVAQRRTLQVAALVVTVVVWAGTGMVVTALLLGAAVVGVPWLIAPTMAASGRITKLEALGKWTQRLAEVTRLGVALNQALVTSRKDPPVGLEEEITELADRIQAGWPADEALADFADRLDDITADKVCAALMLCAVDPGPGLAKVLEDMAASVREEVASRRSIEADRAKSRTTLRWMVIITLSVFAAGFLVPDYTSPYATLLGQLVLGLFGLAFVGVIALARRMARYRAIARFLIIDPRSHVKYAAEPAEVTG
ncbi:type II secretion system F family protein [Streptomyces sp. N35]|uniref:type II secretion system F family protein n=1 Tax=Streptomyces sp. N35 TaxID=2795730 RepID=UPI001F2363FC|nr:type II secretion system F family protein [Streptomyces sp. N35]